MAGLRALPLFVGVFALLRAKGQRSLADPCEVPSYCDSQNVASVSGLPPCESELSRILQERLDCQEEADATYAAAEAEREELRTEWQETSAQVTGIVEETNERQAVLDAINVENDALHEQLVDALSAIGLIQASRSDPSMNETDAWLKCSQDKVSAELALQQCLAANKAQEANQAVSQQHFESLQEAAEQNVNMAKSRLDIIEQQITSATERQERLEQQVADIRAVTPSFATKGVSLRKTVINGSTTNAEHKEHKEEDKEEQSPLEHARERLKVIDAEIEDLEKAVHKHTDEASAARERMQDTASAQSRVADEFNEIKSKTMDAFRKAFELDHQLDHIEMMHDESYVSAKNATAQWETAARLQHEAVAVLQGLITKKQLYQHMVANAEDFKGDPAKATPSWAKDKVPSFATIGQSVFIVLFTTWVA